jgi:hypothetical protein
MFRLPRYFTALLLTSVVAAGTAGAAEQTAANEKDPLKATLLESKEKNRGVTIHANGASIGCVVTSVDEHYVIGRSNQASRVVIRLDRIDGVSAAF